MKRIFFKKAFTLIELIVASLLVLIVLLGVFSINMVLNNNNQDYGQRYLVRSDTQTTLNHILNNASLAVGSANANDDGILIGAPPFNQLNDPNSFCVHQAGTSTLGGSNIVNSANDIWLCYSWAAANQINWCAENYGGPGANPRGASSCSTSAALIANPATGATTTFLGTAKSITSTALTNLPSSPYFVSSTTQLLFSINILNCLNNTAATCNGTSPGVSSDPANNPEVQLSGSIIPSQVST